MNGLERNDLRLGFIPLNDAAPLVVAKELGLFEAEGLRVELSREASWANIRDKVAVGALDGGHMLAPMTLAASIGVGGERTPMTVPLSLNLNGSAVTVSTALAEAMRAVDPEGMAERPRTARPLARLIASRRAFSERPLTFAVVFPYSMHAYELRYWLAAAGVDPDHDIRLVVVPPPRMGERLKAGDIDGFCVAAPWNALSVSQGDGEIVVYASDIWRMGPDKVFGVTRGWAEANPEALQAVVRALLKAAAWADAPENRAQVATLLAGSAYVDVAEAVVRQSLIGSPPYAPGEDGPASQDYLVFNRYAASFPWRSHALWFLTQMRRWGQIGPEVDIRAVADSVYRPDLFRRAAAALGQSAPLVDLKAEGGHEAPWELDLATTAIPMAPDAFLDGRIFDPRQPERYIQGFPISRLGR
ncbi:CmpA/NrtA family ABC transporter substrate-binding protein [Phenylobacterium immobile]|uniref:CmpA/NrtA family ABC transporter substrate-binding protein n=1 Tax=Phenylobacterium immobile TaxID=21 RepID=UPI000AEB4F5A|nr:CmpA/NrtA family ABC transporter substrate-binding protein [Phenylobacterium immobile]